MRKPEGQIGFVHAKRWVVERFFALIKRDRRPAKDVEVTIASAEAFLYAASSILLLRNLHVEELYGFRVIGSFLWSEATSGTWSET